MTSIDRAAYGAYDNFGSYQSEAIAPPPDVASADATQSTTFDACQSPATGGADEGYVVLPTNDDGGSTAAPESSAASAIAAAETTLVQLQAQGAASETGTQAAAALEQLLAATTPETADQLAPALAYWAEVGAGEVFNTTANVQPTEAPGAYDQMISNAAAALDEMANGPSGIDAADVGAMQGALAEAYYAQAADAMFAGDTAAAQAAAEMAMSYIDSMNAAGIDTSEYTALMNDMSVLAELGVMNLSYVDGDAIIQNGQIVINGPNGAIVLDAWEVAMLLDLPRPPVENTDPTTEVGYDGTGLDLSDESGGYDGSFGDTGSLEPAVESGGYDGSFGDTGSLDAATEGGSDAGGADDAGGSRRPNMDETDNEES